MARHPIFRPTLSDFRGRSWRYSLAGLTTMLIAAGITVAEEPTRLRPEERRAVRDLLEERSESLSGRDQHLLRELRRREKMTEQEGRDFERIKRREWGVEPDGSD